MKQQQQQPGYSTRASSQCGTKTLESALGEISLGHPLFKGNQPKVVVVVVVVQFNSIHFNFIQVQDQTLTYRSILNGTYDTYTLNHIE